MQVVRQHYYRPPGRIGPKFARGQPASRQVGLHQRMRLFGFAAPLPVPADQPLALLGAVGHAPAVQVLALLRRKKQAAEFFRGGRRWET